MISAIAMLACGLIIGWVIGAMRFNKALDKMSKEWVEMFTTYEEEIYNLLEDIKDDGK